MVPSDGKEFRKLILEFFRLYGKKFRRCIWKVFSKDKDGNEANTATVMKTPSSKTVPYSKITLYEKINLTYGKADGFVDNETGEIGLRQSYNSQTLSDGTKISGKERFFRVFGHEYANYLSWYYTSHAGTFGSKVGIRGGGSPGGGLKSINYDNDTGARQEKCVWGNTSF